MLKKARLMIDKRVLCVMLSLLLLLLHVCIIITGITIINLLHLLVFYKLFSV